MPEVALIVSVPLVETHALRPLSRRNDVPGPGLKLVNVPSFATLAIMDHVLYFAPASEVANDIVTPFVLGAQSLSIDSFYGMLAPPTGTEWS